MGVVMLNEVISAPVSALGQNAGSCNKYLLLGGVPAWFNDLDFESGTCAVVWPSGKEGDSSSLGEFISVIIKNIIQDLLAVAALVCVGYIIYGGYKLVLSSGDPAAVAKGKKTISGALIGMMISILSYAIIGFVFSVLF